MINGRQISTDFTWMVFQYGHFGFFYTDGRGIARGPYNSMEEANDVAVQKRWDILTNANNQTNSE